MTNSRKLEAGPMKLWCDITKIVLLKKHAVQAKANAGVMGNWPLTNLQSHETGKTFFRYLFARNVTTTILRHVFLSCNMANSFFFTRGMKSEQNKTYYTSTLVVSTTTKRYWFPNTLTCYFGLVFWKNCIVMLEHRFVMWVEVLNND